ncbi:hypothetical protein [Lactococcus garvieae]|uniref:hypothetical protein n=1 Tax=Lactococcus garvieae TaxID=1363 RepID=UPI003853C95A
MRWLPFFIWADTLGEVGGCIVSLFFLFIIGVVGFLLFMWLTKIFFVVAIIVAVAVPLYLGARFLYRRGIRNFGDDED